MAGTIDAGELKLTLRLIRQDFESGIKAVDAAMKGLGTTTTKVGKQAQTSGRGFSDLKSQFAQLGISLITAQQALSAFNEKMAEDTGFNRVVANMRRLGIYTPEAAASIEQATYDMEYLGAKQTELFSEMMPLLTLTRDVEKSMTLLSLAQRAAISTGSPMNQIIAAIADALQGQERTLRPLLRAWGEYNTGIETAADFMAIVQKRADEVSGIYSEQMLSVLALKKSYSDLKESMVETVGPVITGMLRGWAELLTTVDYLLKRIQTRNSEALAKLDLDYYDKIMRIAGMGKTTGAGGVSNLMPDWWDEYLRQLGLKHLGTDRAGERKGKKPEVINEFELLKEQRETVWDWMQENEKRGLDESVTAWHEHYDKINEYLDQFSKQAGSTLADMIVNMKFQLEDLVNFIRRILAEVLGDLLTIQLRGILKGIFPTPAMPGGGGPSWEAPPPAGGYGAASFGGPRPIRPGGVSRQPVYVTINDSATHFSQWCEIVVTTGGERRLALR